MSVRWSLFPLSLFTLGFLLGLSGCKSGTQQTSNPPANPANPVNPQTTQQPQQINGTPVPASSPSPAPSSAQNPPGKPSAGSSQTSAPAQASAPQPPPQPAAVDLPEGTQLTVRLDQDLGSKISRPGDSFSASIADAVVVNGQTVIAKGSRADGTVIDAKPLGRFKGGAVLSIRLDRVYTKWGSYPVATSSISRAEKGKGKRTGEFAGGGGIFGALVGGLAGGKKGALIGTLLGAGAGTAGSAFTGNKDIVLPAETLLTFRLENPIHVSEQKQ